MHICPVEITAFLQVYPLIRDMVYATMYVPRSLL